MTRSRRLVQFGFLSVTLVAVFLLEGNAERWCPLGGVEASYSYLREGNLVCSLGTSNFFALGGALLMTLLVRRAFCGYVCPLGTLSEALATLARWLHLPQIAVHPRVDRWLGAAKYLVLAAILYGTWRAGELLFRGYDPCYALISRHGSDITVWAYVVSGAIVLASLVIRLPFCRWFCPFAAVLQPFSRLALTQIQRNATACTGCGRCSRACPVSLPVAQLPRVTQGSCLTCLSCVEACPQRTPAALSWGLGPWRPWSPAVVVAVVLLCTGGAVAGSYLFPLPSFVHRRGTAPAAVATVAWRVENLTCRGRAHLLVWYLERDDLFAIPGYWKLEAWPGPGWAEVRLSYDPQQTSPDLLQQAITEPYYNLAEDRWRPSPFRLEGYTPWGDDAGPAAAPSP